MNVGGLKNVLQAVRETETIEKLIYTSSFFALGPTDDGCVADENQVGRYIALLILLFCLHFLLRITKIVM